jgi:TPR repeat protein
VPIDSSTAFVSYSREDLEFVLQLTKDLKAKGAKVWIDTVDIRAGQIWEQAIDYAVSECRRMLVVLSPAAVQSKRVMVEISTAFDENKEIIPVMFQECRIPRTLRLFQYADFRTSYDEGLKALLATLGSEPQPAVASVATAAGATSPNPPLAARTITDEESEERKLQEFRRLAEGGDSSAMVDLGNLYQDGRHGLFPSDVSEAIRWYRKAADAGNATAMLNLGLLYKGGRGIAADHNEAVSWFRKAAWLNQSEATFSLGYAYEFGEGIDLDYRQAQECYIKSINCGFDSETACRALDRLYPKLVAEKQRESQRRAAEEKHREEEEVERQSIAGEQARREEQARQAAVEKAHRQEEGERQRKGAEENARHEQE